jgi:hypothetical protein
MTKARTLADNFAADINGITAGTGISGGGTSGTVTVTNEMATIIDAKGDLVGGTGADTFARLAVGANGTVLTADSVETTGLKWAALPASGKVLQVVAATNTTQVSSTSTTYADTGLSATITPTSSSSKILVILTQSLLVDRAAAGVFARLQFLRDSTVLQEFSGGSHKQRWGAEFSGVTYTGLRGSDSFQYLDSPSTTSATTYKMQGGVGQQPGGATWTAYFQYESSVSSIVLMEIGA